MANLDATFGSFNTATSTKHYLMQWKDVDCVTTTYRFWHVTESPDPTGIQYSGTKCGGSAITGAFVSATWIT